MDEGNVDLPLASWTASPQPMAPAMDLALCASFGSAERWRDGFVAMGQAGGSGWLLLSFQPGDGRLVNQWAADPAHTLAGGVPLLALNRDEPSNHRDHGAEAGAGVDALMQHINWAAVHARYQRAVTQASEGLGVTADEVGPMRWIDVRRAGVFEQADVTAPGAEWRDPAQVDAWAAELKAEAPVLVYCVHGHEVSRSTAMRLRAAGVDARFLIGGLDGWRSQGRPVVDKPKP